VSRETFVVEWRGLKRLQSDLELFARKAIPYAAREALNSLAFGQQKNWQSELKKSFILRNQFTVRSIRVERARGLDVRTMEARTGTVATYLADQEEGATHVKSGKHGEPLPAAAPGARKSRRRLVSRSRRIGSIKIMPRVRGSRSRQIGAAFAMARKRGGKQFAFLRISRARRGIFEINPNSRQRGVRKVWDLSKPTVRIPPTPTLGRSFKRTVQMSEDVGRKAMLFQLKRHKVFGY